MSWGRRWRWRQLIAAKPKATVAIGKEAFYRQLEMDLADAYSYAASVMVGKHAARRGQGGYRGLPGKAPTRLGPKLTLRSRPAPAKSSREEPPLGQGHGSHRL